MLDGPRLAPAGGRAARQLVVLLHGYGADGSDLAPLAGEWRAALPDAAFVAPHAPLAMPGGYGGRAWFALTLRDAAELWTGATEAAPALHAFLDAELARHGLTDAALALVGFSQGTMMALHAGLRRKSAPAAIVGFSGHLPGPDRLMHDDHVRPPVLLVHGDSDTVIPVDALHAAVRGLGAAGLSVEWHVAQGLGHGIDAEGLALASRFMADAFRQHG